MLSLACISWWRALFVDRMLRGLSQTPMESFDGRLSKDVTNHLFEEKGTPFSGVLPELFETQTFLKYPTEFSYSGMDLASLNLQRGRDHGLPGYVKYLSWCKSVTGSHVLPDSVEGFADLEQVMGKENVERLSRVYRWGDEKRPRFSLRSLFSFFF